MSGDNDSLRDPVDEGQVTVSSLNFPVVGIGASAGGLNALLQLFGNMPGDSGMAFVVIMHLSPKHESNVAAVLQRATRMNVIQVTQPVAIEAGCIYVIPPTHHLEMNDGYLRLAEPDRPRGRHVAIDLFFRTLAQVHRERAICIVLSGTGADGAVGITRIKEHGGIAIAQTPNDAEYDGMPRAAIATGMVDFVLPVADIPQKLVELWGNAQRIRLPIAPGEDLPGQPIDAADTARAAEEALRELLLLLRSRTGNDFRHYKRATVLRRIERRLQITGQPDLPAYRDYVQAHAEETPALLKDMLISVTNFFRDREAFEALERGVVAPLFANRAAGEQLRVWVAGCATGEEAYSVAMLLLEAAAPLLKPPELLVFATDIDERAIAIARAGLYPESILTDVAPERLRQFFTREQEQYRVRKQVREKVLFAVHNLLRDPPFSKLDLICCRNLLIYLDRDMQVEILEMFHFSLRPGGMLFLGTSESAEAAGAFFTVVDKKNRIYRANPGARTARYVPSLPLSVAGVSKPAYAMTPQASAEKRAASYAELHQRLLERYAPPSVLIDRDNSIVHLSERAGRYLRHGGGVPSHNLLSLVQPELRMELRTALFQAAQTGNSIDARRVRTERDGQVAYVNMSVQPVYDPASATDFMLVLFQEVEDTTGNDVAEPDVGKDRIVQQLEEELRQTRLQLQGVIEQSETSNEELKASNEELQAINEELRSATEELETSKEELQSINEELITVNQELKMKVEETGKVNDDLNNLIASTDIATVFVDRGMHIKRYTPRATELFALIPTDIGRSLLDITHRLGYEQLADDATEVFRSLRTIEREVRSNEGHWYIARLLPYRTTEDRIEGAVLTFIDISGRREAEERVRAGEAQMRLVAESTQDYAIITLDPEGRVNSWNKGAEKMFGHAEEEMLGQPTDLIFVPEDREQQVPQDEMRRARETGRAEDERWHLRKDGSRFYCSGIMTPLGEAGELSGYAKIARDLTGRKHLEAERETLLAREKVVRSEAQAANALKDEFLAVMSHELKNPLNLIQISAELLLRLPEAQQLHGVQRAAESIRRAVSSQAQIIDDMLDLSRMHTGKLQINRSPVSYAEIIHTIIEAAASDAAARKIEVVVELEDDQTLYADPVRVEQIVWNLLSNAIKFTPPGGRITLRMSREDDHARLDVSDTGVGLEPAMLEQVFDMYRQGDRKARNAGGLGIGLALVRQLAQLHGGRVVASSEGKGRGACFTVWLPLYLGLRPDTAGAAGPAAHGQLAGLRVLMVDDAPDALFSFAELLRMEAAEVTPVSSGAAALEQLAQQPYDLLLSDISMPKMDGYELIQQVRSRENGSRLPAIAITGYGRHHDAERVLSSGFDAHLSKPVSLEHLVQTVRRLGIRAARDRP